MDPAAIFVIVAALVIILVFWGFERWRERQFEKRRREYHEEVAAGLVEQFEEGFGEGAVSRKASPVEFHTWFEGELHGYRVELEVDSASERDCRIRLAIYQGPICLPEGLTVYLKSPSGIGFSKRREAGMIDRIELPGLENAGLDVESDEGRVERSGEAIPPRLVEVLAAHRENFHVEPPEDLAERLRAAESLRDLERAYEKVEAEEPTVLQAEVPGEVGIRRDRINLAWLFRGDIENLAGLVEFARYSIRLAEDLEAKVGGCGSDG